jgi:hypothetical protein
MTRAAIDHDALLCALVLAPQTFSRNRFFALFQDPSLRRIRRRAARVRGILHQLLGTGRAKAELTGEQVLEDGQVLIRFRVEDLSYERTAALSALEAAAMRYVLARAGAGTIDDADRDRVLGALRKLGRDVVIDPASVDLHGEHP